MTFAVDDGFSYLVPDGFDVRIGSRVRIKVSGRRMRGFVTAIFPADPTRKLLPIDGVVGDVPSFDQSMLESLRWAATHYVAPLSAVLRRTVPPNIPKAIERATESVVDGHPSDRDGGPIRYHIGAAPHTAAIAESIRTAVSDNRSAVVIAPTADEISSIADVLQKEFGDRVIRATSSMTGAATTKAWARMATTDGMILVGTREVMFWPFGNTGTVVIVEDGRRVMRSPSTPTLSVRDVILRRRRSEGFEVIFHGPVPTLEAMAQGASVTEEPGRQWPAVEIVDRRDEPPGGGLLAERTKAAIRATVAQQQMVFVLVTARGYAPAFRCVACGEIRRCNECGSAASRTDTCRRCGSSLRACQQCGGGRFAPVGAGIGRVIDDIARVVGSEVGKVDEGKLVTVGSERDLIAIHDVGLAVSIDVDGLTMAPHYRASEDALRLLARLAQTVRRGSGSRCLIQTSLPTQAVVEALVSGRSADFLEAELEERGRYGFPPSGSLMAIETDSVGGVGELLTEAIGPHVSLLGPAEAKDRTRWLIQGSSLEEIKLALRPVVSTLRSRGVKVRVDVDPIDL